MAYTVLSRRYRPQTFEDLVGQEHVSRTLGNALKGDRVAHAFLFTGARGVGKTSTARLLAKALNCEQGPTPTPCNACDACKEIAAGTDLDVLEIDGASNNSVEDVRRLQETLPFRPARDRYKVVIVDEVHMLSTGAFNAFLKTLEEPPSHVKFIFATTEIHKVPVTIRSRCQRHDFRLIPQAVVAARVRDILAAEGIEADDAGIAIVAREAAGSMRDALTVLDQLLAFGNQGLHGEEVARGLGIADRARVLEVARDLLGHDARACLVAAHSIAEQGLDVLHFARQLLDLVRDLVVIRVAGDSEGLVDMAEDEREKAGALAGAYSPQELQRAFSGLSQLVEDVGRASNPRVTLEMGLVRLAEAPPLIPLAELVAKLEQLEKRLLSGGGGPGPAGPSRGGGTRSTAGGGARGPVAAPAASTAAPGASANTSGARAAAAAAARMAGGGAQQPRQPASHTAPAGRAERADDGPPPPSDAHAPSAAPPPEATHAERQQPAPDSRRPAPAEAGQRAGAGPGLQRAGSGPSTQRTASAPNTQRTASEPSTASEPNAQHAVSEPATADPETGEDIAPEWLRIVGDLKHHQPALGAIVEHGVSQHVSGDKLVIRFPEGSFFGRQAKAPAAQKAIGDAAERILGARPHIEVRFGSAGTGGGAGATVAEVEKRNRDQRQRQRMDAARNHPTVRDAIEVFPEARDYVDVQVKQD